MISDGLASLVVIAGGVVFIVFAQLARRRAVAERGASLRTSTGLPQLVPYFFWVPYAVVALRPGPSVAIPEILQVAGGALSMWAPIVADNAAEIIVALRACESRLQAFREALEQHDEGTTRRLLDDGCQWFDGDPTAPPRPPA